MSGTATIRLDGFLGEHDTILEAITALHWEIKDELRAGNSVVVDLQGFHSDHPERFVLAIWDAIAAVTDGGPPVSIINDWHGACHYTSHRYDRMVRWLTEQRDNHAKKHGQ